MDMKPSIFISSTVDDLRFLRDAIREVIEIDLAYNPIMSDYGGVGYITPTTAAESCYKTVSQCQLAVLIIGRRYGEIGKDNLSVTHNEFISARESGVPIITFVESEVLTFKQVFDGSPAAAAQWSFPKMDNACKTFALIDEVRNSKVYNGLIPFVNANDAKQKLKGQIAEFVGDRLNGIIRPVKAEIQEVLAELKTLRMEITPKNQQGTEAEKYLRTMRFLLDDKYANFRDFCEAVSEDLDTAVQLLIRCQSLTAFFDELGLKVEVEDDPKKYQEHFQRSPSDPNRLKQSRMGGEGWWALYFDNKVMVSTIQLERFKAEYTRLQKLLANPQMLGFGPMAR